MSSPRLSPLALKATKELVKKQGAPVAALSIPGEVRWGNVDYDKAGAAIKPVGTCRRVFLLRDYLKPDELEGLAYRIDVLTRNEALSSVLMATSETDDVEMEAMPTSAIGNFFPPIDPHFNPDVHRVSSGYDPIEIYKNGDHKNPVFLDHLTDLAIACRGNDSKVPLITLPHGGITDGGYALCMGSYVLATKKTSFQIINPSRGLSLDPVGFSYILPRLGWEYELKAADFPVGMILALGGTHADWSDLMETGLATHYVDSPALLETIEHALGNLPSYEHQAYDRNPIQSYGDPLPIDVNLQYKNRAVAGLMNEVSEFESCGQSLLNNVPTPDFDPSYDLDEPEWELERQSDLVDMAERWDGPLEERTLPGLFSGLRARKDDVAAQKVVERMEMNSPLAMRVIHTLMRQGAEGNESLESCMERELKVQKRMFQSDDFQRWAEHVMEHGGGEEDSAPPFQGWSHSNVQEVSKAQVDELLA